MSRNVRRYFGDRTQDTVVGMGDVLVKNRKNKKSTGNDRVCFSGYSS